MKLKTLYTVIIAFVLSACAADNETSLSEFEGDVSFQAGIVGAENGFSRQDRGYKAAVSLRKNGSAFCTGTLIGERIVLTAAHCLKNKSLSDLSVVFAADLSAKAYAIVRVITHDKFNAQKAKTGLFADYSNDMALVGLSASAPKEAVTAALPSRPLVAGGKYKLRAFGVGQTSGQAPSTSGPMRMVNLIGEVKKNRVYMVSYDQRTGKGFCDGDSGGPHFMYDNKARPILIAISTSVDFAGFMGKAFGDKCRYYSSATQTGYHLTWIKNNKAVLENNLANYYVD